MYTPRAFFEGLIASGGLSEYLFDAFERHSNSDHIQMTELEHAMDIKKRIGSELGQHESNRSVSHEMWAVATLVSQFQRVSNPQTVMPEFLGQNVYNQSAFTEAFYSVRRHLQSLQLKRA